ncbi:MAG: DUF305 domain-containing protein [Gemmatimonadetes bacterium]|nr:DUF305 domain-containing protein [Gemmatimonadota bacterium]
MHETHGRRALPILLTLVSLTAVGCASGSGSVAAANTPTDRGAATQEPDYDRLEAIARARADSARMNVSEADVEFMQGMIHHHAQALVMSALAPTNGASPRIQTLTARIINAQRDEIWVMQRWLRERDRAAPDVAEDGTIPGMDHSMHMDMVGMLSPAQLDELRAARGPDFDRLFLTYMIQHHEGAVVMVEELFTIDGAAQDDAVFKIASDIQVDQRTEIARMQRMLDAMHPEPDAR